MRGLVGFIWIRMPRPFRRLIDSLLLPFGHFLARRLVSTPAHVSSWIAHNRRPITIVIPSFNDYRLLRKCLRSIAKTCEKFEYSVIIVDDYCQPRNSARLRRLISDRVNVIFKDRRQGFAVSVNRGMERSTGDIILMNSDIVALPGWLDALQWGAYGHDPEIGLVSPKLLYPNGRIQYGGTFQARHVAPQWFAHRFAGRWTANGPANESRYIWGASGACLYITRTCYDRLGGFDEEYWLGFEDVDYAMRAWSHHFRSRYEPASQLFHVESATRGYSQGPRELQSMRHFWQKWGGMSLDQRAVDNRIDFIISDENFDTLWGTYVMSLARELTRQGRRSRVHVVGAGQDDKIIRALSPHESIKVACDLAAADAVWLSAVTAGIPLMFFNGQQSALSPSDIASMAPEFDYIVTSGAIGRQVSAASGWSVREIITPGVIGPSPITNPRRTGIAVVGTRESCDVIAAALGNRTSVTPFLLENNTLTAQQLARIEAAQPRIIVYATTSSSPLDAVSLMSLGSAFVAWANQDHNLVVLDGLNALLAPHGDFELLVRHVVSIIDDDCAFTELADNARKTAEFESARSLRQLSSSCGLGR